MEVLHPVQSRGAMKNVLDSMVRCALRHMVRYRLARVCDADGIRKETILQARNLSDGCMTHARYG